MLDAYNGWFGNRDAFSRLPTPFYAVDSILPAHAHRHFPRHQCRQAHRGAKRLGTRRAPRGRNAALRVRRGHAAPDDALRRELRVLGDFLHALSRRPLPRRHRPHSHARPTVERNVSGLAVHREGETLLFECGEGTQRQMMRYGVSFAFSEIFFTHFHADHFLGVIGLIRTLGLQGRPEPLFLYGPKGAKKVLSTALQLGVERVPFPVEIVEVKARDSVTRDGGGTARDGYDIFAFPTEHGGGASLGYVLKEHVRRGRFDVEKARALGIPEGPLWGKLTKGEDVALPDGTTVRPAELVGPARSGRLIVFTGDTRPCAATVDAAQGADLLIHEATF